MTIDKRKRDFEMTVLKKVIVLTVLIASCVSAANVEYYDIVVDKNQSVDEASFWLRYGLDRVLYRNENPIKSPAGTTEIIPSLAEEMHGRLTLLKDYDLLKAKAKDNPKIDIILPYLKFLVSINKAGFLQEYVWVFHRREDWKKPENLKLSEFGLWLGENSPVYVPKTGAILRLNNKNKNDLVTEAFSPSDENENMSIVATPEIEAYNSAELIAKQFIENLDNGDHISASKLFAGGDKLPKQVSDREITKLSRLAKDCVDKKWHISYVEMGVIGNCAAAIVCEDVKQGKAAYDLDPLLIVKQDGNWGVVPGMSNMDYAKVLLSEKDYEQMEKCYEWAESRMKELANNRTNEK